MKFIFKITLLLLLLPAITFANNFSNKKTHEKSKEIQKRFKVNKDATLSVSNKYGNIYATTWNKNSIEIDVKITVKGNDLDEVEKRLSEIIIEFEGNDSEVKAKTIFEKKRNSWSFWGKTKKINYQIDYTIKMPVSNNINFNNDYGRISLDKLEGIANINCDYGKITIGDLLGQNSNINLDYCSSSSVNSMVDGNINTDYSKLEIEKAQNLKVNSDYSTLSLGKVNSVNFNTDYGNISIKDVETVIGNGDYTGLKFGTIRKALKVSSDYGSVKIEDLAPSFSDIFIDCEYASVNIGVSSAARFNFKLDMQYGTFKRNDSKITISKSIVKNTKKYYEGKYNGGGKSSIYIKSNFGSVKID